MRGRRRHSQSTATARAEQMSRMRASLNRPSRSTSKPTDTDSTESRLTAHRFGTGSSPGSRTTSLRRPRPRDDDRRQVVHTTTLLLVEHGSSSRHCVTERRQVTPLVGFVEGMGRVGRDVGGIDLRSPVAGDQRCQGLIHEVGVRQRGAPTTRLVERPCVDRGADPNPRRSTNVARLCHHRRRGDEVGACPSAWRGGGLAIC